MAYSYGTLLVQLQSQNTINCLGHAVSDARIAWYSGCTKEQSKPGRGLRAVGRL
jgi:hypothetical protein